MSKTTPHRRGVRSTPTAPSGNRRHRFAPAARILVLAVAVLAGLLAACNPINDAARIDLRVLVLDDGSVNVEMLLAELDLEGVPHDVIDLTDGGRSPITPALLADDTAEGGKGHAFYQGVILPTHAPTELTATEMSNIEAFQRHYGIRRLAAFAWPGPESGAQWPATGPLYAGSLDGSTAHTAASIPWLDGPIPIDGGSWGALAVPQQVDGKNVFESIITVPVPGSGQQAPILGMATGNGLDELQLTITGNEYQEYARVIAPVAIDYLTRGVHLGQWRNYFAVHIDDVFLPDERWSTTSNCTPGEDCPTGITTPEIRMTPAEVSSTIAWQNANGFTLDLAYNGGGSQDAQDDLEGPDPLTEALKANVGQFDWINHTYRHEFLGCIKDTSVRPWQCQRTFFFNQIVWFSQANIQSELNTNIAWASTNGIPIDQTEVVTGEHSGLATLPQQPIDNPNLVPALNNSPITWMASDASREHDQRQVGPALTVPRYPMNIFYNVATEAEEVDEYNWIYTSAADGGSGICETDPNSTCITPLGPGGFDSYIVPTETTIAMQHVLRNDPRPTYAHQSNLSEDQVLLPVLSSILNRYKGIYSDSAPIVSPTMTQSGTLIRDMTRWATVGVVPGSQVTAYRQNGQVVINTTGSAVAVPLTVGLNSSYGESWGGRRSGWTTVAPGTPFVVDLGS
ncbi:MAG: hypothetical protein KF906_07605 [Actinobacteria bacterium]|nr:hypothetical protein [Actinomycetota bacterium]